jgi:hypothetical protein
LVFQKKFNFLPFIPKILTITKYISLKIITPYYAVNLILQKSLAIASCGTRGLRVLTEPSKLRAARCLKDSVSLVLQSSLSPFLAMFINNILLQILLGAEAVGPMSQVLEVIVGLLNIRGRKSGASRACRDAGALEVVQSIQSVLPIQPVDLVDGQKSEGLGHEGEDNLGVGHGGGVGGFGDFGGFEDGLAFGKANASRNGGDGGCGRDCEGVHGGSRREGGNGEEEGEESKDGGLYFDR